MKNIIFLLLISPCLAFSQLVINEFMPIPNGDEPEWVELFNNNNFDIEINNYYIGDKIATRMLPKTTVLAKSYILITKDSNELKKTYQIPSNTAIIELNLPALNNTTDEIRLLNGNILLDSIYYDMKLGKTGKSFERIQADLPAGYNQNLGVCESPNNATPALENSISKVEFDLKIVSAKINTNDIAFEVINNGSGTILNYKLKLYIFKDGTYNKIYENQFDTYSPTIQKSIISSSISNVGFVTLKAEIENELDMRIGNNTLEFEYYISYPRRSILINEFLFDNDTSMSEFIELYNTTADTVNLRQWIIDDEVTYKNNTGLKIEDNFFILPEDYVIVVSDSALFNNVNVELKSKIYISKNKINLNNDKDLILLKNPNFEVIDSLYYNANWHTKGIVSTKNKSLEKINPNIESEFRENWLTAGNESGSTPATKNSIDRNVSNSLILEISPNPFSTKKPVQLGGGALISYDVNIFPSFINLYIYSPSGVIIKRLADNKYTNSIGSIIWDGTNEEGIQQPPGVYIVLLEAHQNSGNTYLSEKKVIVIGE